MAIPRRDPARRLPLDFHFSLILNIFVVTGAALTALASPRRREILRLIWDDERAAGEIHAAMPDVSFAAVSLQLRALDQAGLVDCRREHRHRVYSARREALGPVAAALERMWEDSLWRLKLQAELEQTRRGPKPRRRRRGA